MARKKFVRKDAWKKVRLGKKGKQKWRKPKGRHGKVREKRKGHVKQPSIGYCRPKAIKGFVAGAKPKLIYQVEDLNAIKEDEIAVLGRIGRKRKIEMAKAALERKVKLLNLNAKAFLAQVEKESRKKIEEKKKEKPTAESVPKKEEKTEEMKETKEKAIEPETSSDREEKQKLLKEKPKELLKVEKTKFKKQEIRRKSLEK